MNTSISASQSKFQSLAVSETASGDSRIDIAIHSTLHPDSDQSTTTLSNIKERVSLEEYKRRKQKKTGSELKSFFDDKSEDCGSSDKNNNGTVEEDNVTKSPSLVGSINEETFSKPQRFSRRKPKVKHVDTPRYEIVSPPSIPKEKINIDDIRRKLRSDNMMPYSDMTSGSPILFSKKRIRLSKSSDDELSSSRRSRSRKPSPKVLEYTDLQKRTRKPRKVHQMCSFCDFTCKYVKDLIMHCDLKHPDQVYKCPHSDCSYKGKCLAKLRIHQHNYKHFDDDIDIFQPNFVTSKKDSENEDKTEDTLPPLSSKINKSKDCSHISHSTSTIKVKRRLSFGINNDAEPVDPAQVESSAIHGVGENYNNLFENICNDLKEMDEVQSSIVVGDTEKPRMIPGPPGPAPSGMMLACPVMGCNLTVPIFQSLDSTENAQDIIYKHQKQDHQFNESQFVTQVIDDAKKGDVEDANDNKDTQYELLMGEYQQASSDLNSTLDPQSNWQRKLRNLFESIVDRDQKSFAHIVIRYEEQGSVEPDGVVTMTCFLGRMTSEGQGATMTAATEDAAHNMYQSLRNMIVDKEDIIWNLKNAICGI